MLPKAVLQAQVGHLYKCSRATFPCLEATNTRLECQSSFSGASFHVPWPRHTFRSGKKAWAHGPQRQLSCLFFETPQPMVAKTPSRFTQRLVQHLSSSRRTRALLVSQIHFPMNFAQNDLSQSSLRNLQIFTPIGDLFWELL